MELPVLTRGVEQSAEGVEPPRPQEIAATEGARFRDQFEALFERDFPRLFRILDRISGEPELAADLAQEAFIRLYRRGSLPDAPQAWLISVAMNLLRNAKTSLRRRRRLLSLARAEAVHSDPPPSPGQFAEAEESRRRVRVAIDRLPERERRLLMLRAEGYAYRDIARALELNEASVGTLLARAKRIFRESYQRAGDAP